MSVVVDASLIVALVVEDARQAAAQAHLERWVDAGESLHAPAVLPYEVANVLSRLAFNGVLAAEDIGRNLVPSGISSPGCSPPREGPRSGRCGLW